MFAQEIDSTFSPFSRNFICWIPGWSSLNKTCSDTRFQISNLPVSEDTMYFPSGVISAWVTMAPKWLSASLDKRRPERNSQTPTQLLVTVAARSVCDKLPNEFKLVSKWNYPYGDAGPAIYLILSICSSWRSITWTCSKILLIFQTLTERSIDEVMTLFQLPIVRASSWIMRPKWASNIFSNCLVSKHQTYRFFL